MDLTESYTKILKIEDDEPYTDQFNSMGYQSMLVVLNLGILVLGLTIPFVLFFIVSAVIKLWLPRFHFFRMRLTNYLFFNKTFDFINETYLLLAMCSCLNLTELHWDSYGQIINSVLAVILLVVVATFPTFIYFFY